MPPTWEQFKAAVRKHDRDSLLIIAARMTAAIARDDVPESFRKYGLNPWNLASVARTALAWSSFQRPTPTAEQFLFLCSMDANLSDEVSLSSGGVEHTVRLGKLFSRIFFEQFPGQHSVLAEVARSLLLFGSASEAPPGFQPKAMKPHWFEAVSNGLSLDEYVGSIFLIAVAVQLNDGIFDLRWLDEPQFAELGDVINLPAVRRIFTDLLVTTPADFKAENRKCQEPLPSPQKKYAFNPLQDKPFIEIAENVTIAPWAQAVLMKALPPSIYHLARNTYGDDFTGDLGHVYQHYVGRQLQIIEGKKAVIPEVSYGPRKDRRDSCDWFLDLPGLLVLVECKARQPIESLRTGGDEWLRSVEGSINKGIAQLCRSNNDIVLIAAENSALDPNKKRVGLVVTLGSFFVNNNPMLQEQLPSADFPVGVISIGELESLVNSDADTIAATLLAAPRRSENQLMLLAPDSDVPIEKFNQLLVDTWDSIPFFQRIEEYSERAPFESEVDE